MINLFIDDASTAPREGAIYTWVMNGLPLSRFNILKT